MKEFILIKSNMEYLDGDMVKGELETMEIIRTENLRKIYKFYGAEKPAIAFEEKLYKSISGKKYRRLVWMFDHEQTRDHAFNCYVETLCSI